MKREHAYTQAGLVHDRGGRGTSRLVLSPMRGSISWPWDQTWITWGILDADFLFFFLRLNVFISQILLVPPFTLRVEREEVEKQSRRQLEETAWWGAEWERRASEGVGVRLGLGSQLAVWPPDPALNPSKFGVAYLWTNENTCISESQNEDSIP